MRYSELRLLRWGQVDFASKALTVGASKTDAGTGRAIPLNDRAVAILGYWADLFPTRDPKHFVFPAERYGLAQCKDARKGTTRVLVQSTESMKGDVRAN